jgi:hypothetical protein
MSEELVRNFRLSFRRRDRNVDSAIEDGSVNAEAIRALASLRGIRPEMVRSLYSGSTTTSNHGSSMGQALADLPGKILRR